MSEALQSESIGTRRTRSVWRKGLTALALAGAVGGGYALHGTPHVTAQNGGVPGDAPPVVQTAASRDASNIQKAFQDVAREAQPAVVTIVTEGARPVSTTRRTPRVNPFGQNQNQNNGSTPFGDQDLQEFFKQFQRNFGFSPNSAQRQQMGRQYFRRLQDDDSRGGGLGSGMIFRSDGLILTNAHVVRGATTVTVQLNDGREFKRAKVLGVDERTDVAVVKVNATDLPTVKFGDSSDVEVGDWAIAVGNPFGLAHTVTVGVISAKAREVNIDPRSPGDYLQTDASINPGNSGGPLMDINGRVIGINNAIYSQSGGNVGIGFAIPIDTARNIADRLLRDGKIVRGYLGVEIRTIDNDEDAISLGYDANARGVFVNKVDANTPGAKAGLQPGDLITAFNGQKVMRSSELQRMVGDAPVNSQVKLTVQRDGQTTTLTATLSQLPGDAGKSNAPQNNTPTPDNNATAPSTLGLRLRAITPQLAQRYGIAAGIKGVVVVAVDDNGPGGGAGIQEGDVIERVAQVTVTTPAEVQANVTKILNRQAEGDKSVSLFINTKGERRFVVVTTEDAGQ